MLKVSKSNDKTKGQPTTNYPVILIYRNNKNFGITKKDYLIQLKYSELLRITEKLYKSEYESCTVSYTVYSADNNILGIELNDDDDIEGEFEALNYDENKPIIPLKIEVHFTPKQKKK